MISISQGQGFFILFVIMISHILGMFYVVSLIKYAQEKGTKKESTMWNLAFNSSLIFVFIALQGIFGTMGYILAPLCFIALAVVHRILLTKLVDKL
jgi:hypothetical protein